MPRVDEKTLKKLGVLEDEAVVETIAKIEEELQSDEFKTAPSNESIENLLEASKKVENS